MNIHGHGPVYAEDPEYQFAEGNFEPTWQSLQSVQCPEWFRHAKLGFWPYWWPQAVPMYGDWYAQNMYIERSDQYRFQWRDMDIPTNLDSRTFARYGRQRSSIRN